jgi:hypothetical protein
MDYFLFKDSTRKLFGRAERITFRQTRELTLSLHLYIHYEAEWLSCDVNDLRTAYCLFAQNFS